MARYYIGFDDTDTLDCGRGTGKLARWFCDELPEEFETWWLEQLQEAISANLATSEISSALQHDSSWSTLYNPKFLVPDQI